jgi:hypothetical protein
MAGCGHCGGCCAHCGATCGAIGGFGLGGFSGASGGLGPTGFGMGGLGGMDSGFHGFGFLPFFGHSQKKPKSDDDKTPVDCDALVNHDDPSHQAAIQTISHVDDEKHEKILQWLKDELHKA